MKCISQHRTDPNSEKYRKINHITICFLGGALNLFINNHWSLKWTHLVYSQTRDWSHLICHAAVTSVLSGKPDCELSLANLLDADAVFLSPLQESPSLWHFMTMRRGQKTTSASGKENGSRLSTARKSWQLLIRPLALGRNAEFPILSQSLRGQCCWEESRMGRWISAEVEVAKRCITRPL